jgi:hypothetical protein
MEPTFQHIFGDKKRDGAWFANCDPLLRRHECGWLLRSIHDIGAAVMKMQADTTRLSCRYRTLKVLTDVDLEAR